MFQPRRPLSIAMHKVRVRHGPTRKYLEAIGLTFPLDRTFSKLY